MTESHYPPPGPADPTSFSDPAPVSKEPAEYERATAPTSPRRRSRVALVIAAVVALLIVGSASVIPTLLSPDEPGERASAPTGKNATTAGVQEFTFDDVTHEPGDITYDHTPPAGGNHNDEWWDCGTFDQPVRDENVVHSLEHGTVWLTYLPGTLNEAEIEGLAEELPDKQIISPYPGQEADLIVTVWGRQLDLSGPDDPALTRFLREYSDGHTSPEPFASCQGGVSEDPSTASV